MVRADAQEVTRFAAGETKRFIFDLWVRRRPTRYDIGPGTWTSAEHMVKAGHRFRQPLRSTHKLWVIGMLPNVALP